MNSDLGLYKVFYIVASLGNISRAAEVLYISQPAVSKSIKLLEESLGITLFSRNSRGVSLSHEGLLLYESVRKAFKELELAEDLLQKLKNNSYGTITLGVSTTIGKNILLPYLKSFTKDYPELKIKVINTTASQTLQLTEEGKIDLAIVAMPSSHTSLALIPLQEIQDILVASPEYIIKLGLHSQEALFQKATFMLLEKPNATRMYLESYFAEHEFTVIPDIEASNMDFLIECAKIGLGVTSVIRNFVEEDLAAERLAELPLTPPIPPRLVTIAYHSKMPLSIASQTFIQYLQQSVHLPACKKHDL